MISAERIDARLLLDAVSPRPLAWVTTHSAADGRPNIAPFSAITLVSTEPPVLLLIVQPAVDGGRKSTAQNVSATGEFVVNMLSERHLEPLMAAAEPDVRPEDRFRIAGAELKPGQTVSVPHLADAVFVLECKVARVDALDSGVELFFADIASVLVSNTGNDTPPPFLGALGFEWFATNEGVAYVSQAHLTLD